MIYVVQVRKGSGAWLTRAIVRTKKEATTQADRMTTMGGFSESRVIRDPDSLISHWQGELFADSAFMKG
jgi:hypothetical protein